MTETSIKASTSTHQLLPFLLQQSQGALTRLYQQPSSCLSVFRLLAPLERQIVMNLLWLETAIPSQTMAAWVYRDSKKLYENALNTLFSLHIISNPAQRLSMNPTFKSSLRAAITGGGEHRSFGVPAEKDGRRSSVSVDMLDAYAIERWETILHYMVSSGSSSAAARPSQGALLLLEKSGLMTKNGLVTFAGWSETGRLQITSIGFQFLLYSPHAQLWELLLQYLHMAEERQMDLIEVLGFLFMLSTMELGRDYSTENLGATQMAMLEDLRDYGLVWQRKPSSKKFSPTRLATTLTSSLPPLPSSSGTSSGADSGSHTQGFIILETNYRVYAYTNNPLQTAVLNLFVTLKSRFPNLVVGTITRESVKKALSNGITADQIIKYLTAHAHPQMRKNNPLIPVTVQDQIRLWELEKNRLKSQEGYLYTSFASQADYDLILRYAKQLNVVLWENASKRCFFGSIDGHANIRGFIERRTNASR